ncbi:hypothetical protein KC343_g13219 [Hortaea werneckii]|nr:hypothetical protein KC352_g26651 [Hortaea werneckii]KAI7549404.1 hypothetical protein KC317_g14575 [Hortaea werneckii]KAI7585617.1 hypothetical protein KC346_g17664 [Hortaea werneckii]KAI7607033.1 hypothetical protein KC343_g13219 [Hortaea werneckii]KAI7642774.1 hypothetical protein KC319_g12910 [Hortaea werneckii]
MLAAPQDSGQQARPAASGTVDSRPARLSGTQLSDDGTIDTPPASTPCVQQTKGFLDALSPELRNLIYSSIFAQHADGEEALIICAPHHDWAMTTASQPAITRVCRTVRKESLAMFYTNSTFEAYITNWDIRKLCRWAQHVSDLPIPIPKITIRVKLLDRMVCELQLLWIMRLWRDTKHDGVNVKVHDITEQPELFPISQYFLFSFGIIDAEHLAMVEDYSALSLTAAWSELVGHVLGILPQCSPSRVSEAIYGCDKHGIMVY